MKVSDRAAESIDYRLNILGIRVWRNGCQLIAKSNGAWSTLGPRWDLPVTVPRNAAELKDAAADTLRLAAYQYNAEQPGSDLIAVLGRCKDFEGALTEEVEAPASEV